MLPYLLRFSLGFLLVFMSFFLIALVLIQRGRGGGLAGAFGGAGGQSAFGTKAGDIFTRITVGVAACWILLCILAINVLGTSSSRLSGDLGGKAVEPAASDIPVEPAASDIPVEPAADPKQGDPATETKPVEASTTAEPAPTDAEAKPAAEAPQAEPPVSAAEPPAPASEKPAAESAAPTAE